MPTVHDVLSQKGSTIHCVSPRASVLEATQRMNQHKIGALVVGDGEHISGIFTERDVLSRIVVPQRDPAKVTVGEVMTEKVICCTPDTDLDEASAIMKTRRVRHLPVCTEDGRLVGMISIGDINACYASNQEQTIHYLHDYIYGRV
jgi:CBS domain-containing protein